MNISGSLITSRLQFKGHLARDQVTSFMHQAMSQKVDLSQGHLAQKGSKS